MSVLHRHNPVSFTHVLAINYRANCISGPVLVAEGVEMKKKTKNRSPCPCPHALMEESALRKFLGQQELKLLSSVTGIDYCSYVNGAAKYAMLTSLRTKFISFLSLYLRDNSRMPYKRFSICICQIEREFKYTPHTHTHTEPIKHFAVKTKHFYCYYFIGLDIAINKSDY